MAWASALASCEHARFLNRDALRSASEICFPAQPSGMFNTGWGPAAAASRRKVVRWWRARGREPVENAA
jgi:hypothetical protein